MNKTPDMALCLVVALVLCVSLAAAQTLVTIPELGSIQGKTSQSYFTNRTIYEFLGIPYAERPDRFRPPSKKMAWEGVLNATSFGRICPQTSLLDTSSTGDLEDCLFLDVYSPKVSNDAKLPVLFFVHGGAFVAGSSQVVTPGFFLEHDIVLVSIQYRLGVLGFLSLGIEDIPGNAGMYDQLMTLQWVHDNIQYFGGDPEKITVSGESAGAVSASLLYVSPLTQDIIKQSMMFSGSAVAMWSVGSRAVSDGLDITQYAGCQQGDKLLPCLQNVNPVDLVRAYNQYQIDERKRAHSEMRGINPVVDGNFLNALPLDILKNSSFKGRPMIISVTKHEGLLWEPILYQYYLQANNLADDQTTLKYDILDVLLSYTDQEDTSCTIAKAIQDEHFKEDEFGNYTAMRAGIIDYLGAAYFKGPARKMAELNDLRGGPSYLVTYDYYMPEFHLGAPVIPHGYGNWALFPDSTFPYSAEDLAVARNLTAIYANFISTGIPNGVFWGPYSLENGQYLVVDSTLTTRSYFEQEYTVAEREGLYK